ncbi:MAG TPA: transporter substrate-binding domain-containing protein [Methylovirgula sp.]|nr:transporter substrate-binding domain-containing protein [Methylovirgula sp.]
MSHKALVARIAIAGLFLGLLTPGLADPAPAFVPDFFDPQHKVDKPDLSGLQSLRFLTEDDYPPFHFALPDGTLAGFDVDLARAICEELKIACTIQARRFDLLAPALNAGDGDALIASLRIDAQSRAKFDFTSPYYATPARFVTLTKTALEAIPEGLAGRRIGVIGKTAHEAYLKIFFPKTLIRTYDSRAALYAALKKGDIAAFFDDAIISSFWLAGADAQKCCAFRGGPFTESRFFGEGVGIAVKKGNRTLRQALDYALAQLAKNGTYTDLYLKYFPIGFY